MIIKIKVKPKGQNTYPNELILALLQGLASVEKDFVYLDRKHYIGEGSSWLERPFHFEFYHQLRLKFEGRLKRHKIQASKQIMTSLKLYAKNVGSKTILLLKTILSNLRKIAFLS